MKNEKKKFQDATFEIEKFERDNSVILTSPLQDGGVGGEIGGDGNGERFGGR